LAGWRGALPKGRREPATRRPVGAIEDDPAAIVLHTPLPLDEARARLAGRGRRRSSFPRWGGKQAALVGTVQGDSLLLAVTRLYGLYPNPFQKLFDGHLVGEAGGTRVEGRVRLNRLIVAVMFLWFGLMALVLMLVVVTAVRDRLLVPVMEPFAFIASMGLLGLGFVYVGRWLARYDRDDIARLLAEALDETDGSTPRLGDR
jgi:hypothetical protein